MTSFAVSLTLNDWDKMMGGWRCPALRIPGAIAKAFYVSGSKLDDAWYSIDQPQQLIRWVRSEDPPKSAALVIALTKELVATEKRDFWKIFALFVPVLAAIVSGLASYQAALVDSKGSSLLDEVKAPEPVPNALGVGESVSGRLSQDFYERWTVVGRVKVQDSGPHAVLAMVHPPLIPFSETGKFEADIPVLHKSNGDREFPTLTFVPRQPGYKPANVELGDERAEVVGKLSTERSKARTDAKVERGLADKAEQILLDTMPAYQSPDYKLKVDFDRLRIDVRSTIPVERDLMKYSPQAASAAQDKALRQASTPK